MQFLLTMRGHPKHSQKIGLGEARDGLVVQDEAKSPQPGTLVITSTLEHRLTKVMLTSSAYVVRGSHPESVGLCLGVGGVTTSF